MQQLFFNEKLYHKFVPYQQPNFNVLMERIRAQLDGVEILNEFVARPHLQNSQRRFFRQTRLLKFDQVFPHLIDVFVDLFLSVARGSYQRNLILCRTSWAGSDLKGKASSYAAHYSRSRDNLIGRLNEVLSPLDWVAESIIVARKKQLVLLKNGKAYVW